MKNRKPKTRTRNLWADHEIEYMRTQYPHTLTAEIMSVLGRSKSSVYQQARVLGLRKTEEYFQKHGQRLYPGLKKGRQMQFKPGNIPHNKGKRGWQAGGNSKQTRFKKGDLPHNWKPVGSLRRTEDGILQQKISDTRCSRRDWKAVHALLWEEHFGEIPAGHIVVFKNKNSADIRIENLECITRAENMRRNSVHNLPAQLKEVVMLRGVLNRHINKKGRNHEKQD